MRQSQQQTTEQLAAVTTQVQQMYQQIAEACGQLPMMHPREADKLAAVLMRGLPGQRAAEERKRKKRAENILYGDL